MVVGLSSSLLLVVEGIRDCGANRAVARVEQTQKLIKKMAVMLKTVCTDIRPPALDTCGLSGALSELVSQFRSRNRIELRHAIDLPDDGKTVDSLVAIVIYRLAQESLNNLAKYSKARNAQIAVKYDGNKVTLAVSDDGCGFDSDMLQSQSSLGLRIMREEAESIGGNLLIDSKPGRGVIIKAEFPRRLPPDPMLGSWENPNRS